MLPTTYTPTNPIIIKDAVLARLSTHSDSIWVGRHFCTECWINIPHEKGVLPIGSVPVVDVLPSDAFSGQAAKLGIFKDAIESITQCYTRPAEVHILAEVQSLFSPVNSNYVCKIIYPQFSGTSTVEITVPVFPLPTYIQQPSSSSSSSRKRQTPSKSPALSSSLVDKKLEEEESSLTKEVKKTKSSPNSFNLITPYGTPWVEEQAIKLTKHYNALSEICLEQLNQINTEIALTGIPSRLQLVTIDTTLHQGIFLKPSANAIEKDTLIGIYSGRYELITPKALTSNIYLFDVVTKHIKLNADTIKYATYPKQSRKNDKFFICINGENEGNFTRFINHSSDHANVNPDCVKLQDHKPVIAFFAKKRILPGEQLLYNYGTDYWKALDIDPQDMKPDTYLLNEQGNLQQTTLPP